MAGNVLLLGGELAQSARDWDVVIAFASKDGSSDSDPSWVHCACLCWESLRLLLLQNLLSIIILKLASLPT